MPQQLTLKVLWLKNVLGLGINQTVGNQTYPITPYYFWPKTEAWEQLKLELDSKPWLSKKEKILVLNLTTDIVNHWRNFRTTESFGNIKDKFCDVEFVELNS